MENVPDELDIVLWSDSGVDECDVGEEIVIEDAYRHTYTLSGGKKFEDESE